MRNPLRNLKNYIYKLTLMYKIIGLGIMEEKILTLNNNNRVIFGLHRNYAKNI